MPATIVGTAAIATHAEILRMSSFWRTLTRVRFASRTLVSRSRNVCDLLDDAQQVVVDVAEVLGELVGHEAE